MNYFDLLPQNIHEDIATRLFTDKPFDVEIAYHKGLGQHQHGVAKFVLTFSRQHDIPENIRTNYAKRVDNIFNRAINFEYETISLDLNNFVIEDSILIGNFGTILKFLYDGDRVFITDPNPKIIYLTQEAEHILINLFYAQLECAECREGFEIKRENRTIIVENQEHVSRRCCNITDKKKRTGVYTTEYQFFYPDEFRLREPVTRYQTCLNIIDNIHTSCKRVCGTCSGIFCKNCKNICPICKVPNCGLEECDCTIYCNVCSNVV